MAARFRTAHDLPFEPQTRHHHGEGLRSFHQAAAVVSRTEYAVGDNGDETEARHADDGPTFSGAERPAPEPWRGSVPAVAVRQPHVPAATAPSHRRPPLYANRDGSNAERGTSTEHALDPPVRSTRLHARYAGAAAVADAEYPADVGGAADHATKARIGRQQEPGWEEPADQRAVPVAPAKPTPLPGANLRGAARPSVNHAGKRPKPRPAAIELKPAFYMAVAAQVADLYGLVGVEIKPEEPIGRGGFGVAYSVLLRWKGRHAPGEGCADEPANLSRGSKGPVRLVLKVQYGDNMWSFAREVAALQHMAMDACGASGNNGRDDGNDDDNDGDDDDGDDDGDGGGSNRDGDATNNHNNDSDGTGHPPRRTGNLPVVRLVDSGVWMDPAPLSAQGPNSNDAAAAAAPAANGTAAAVGATAEHGGDRLRRWLLVERCQTSLFDLVLCADMPARLAALPWVASDLLGGLARLHEAGIIHRDVKPDNVLLAWRRASRSELARRGLRHDKDVPSSALALCARLCDFGGSRRVPAAVLGVRPGSLPASADGGSGSSAKAVADTLVHRARAADMALPLVDEAVHMPLYTAPVCTWAYMAPEMSPYVPRRPEQRAQRESLQPQQQFDFKRIRRYTSAVDVWSAGVTLLDLVLGMRSFWLGNTEDTFCRLNSAFGQAKLFGHPFGRRNVPDLGFVDLVRLLAKQSAVAAGDIAAHERHRSASTGGAGGDDDTAQNSGGVRGDGSAARARGRNDSLVSRPFARITGAEHIDDPLERALDFIARLLVPRDRRPSAAVAHAWCLNARLGFGSASASRPVALAASSALAPYAPSPEADTEAGSAGVDASSTSSLAHAYDQGTVDGAALWWGELAAQASPRLVHLPHEEAVAMWAQYDERVAAAALAAACWMLRRSAAPIAVLPAVFAAMAWSATGPQSDDAMWPAELDDTSSDGNGKTQADRANGRRSRRGEALFDARQATAGQWAAWCASCVSLVCAIVVGRNAGPAGVPDGRPAVPGARGHAASQSRASMPGHIPMEIEPGRRVTHVIDYAAFGGALSRTYTALRCHLCRVLDLGVGAVAMSGAAMALRREEEAHAAIAAAVENCAYEAGLAADVPIRAGTGSIRAWVGADGWNQPCLPWVAPWRP